MSGLLLGALCSGCSRVEPTPLERGQATFVRNCSGCHGIDGRGIGAAAAAFSQPPQNLTDPAFHAEHTDDQLLFVLRNGKGNMPPFGVLLTEDQLRQVLAYVRTLPGKRAP